MELFHVDDSNEAFSGFCSLILKMMSLMKFMITNDSPDEDLVRSGPHTATLIV